MTTLSKKTATTVYHENGETVCRYHQTAIVRASDNKVTLDSGGWRTVTTKRRMNQCFEEWGIPYGVYQSNFKWFVGKQGTNGFENTGTPFHDGMVLEY